MRFDASIIIRTMCPLFPSLKLILWVHVFLWFFIFLEKKLGSGLKSRVGRVSGVTKWIYRLWVSVEAGWTQH